MALKSMTGYGRGEGVRGGVRATVELSSVNRKQCDIALQLPRPYAALEPDLRRLAREVIERGRVTGAVSFRWSSGPSRRVEIDRDRAAETARELRAAAEELGLNDDLSASTLLRVPDLVHLSEAPSDPEVCRASAELALRRALRELDRMRRREGRELERDIRARLRTMEQHLTGIDRCSGNAAVRYRQRLREELRAAGVAENHEGEQWLVREVAAFLDRVDITEERTRLRSHIRQFRQSMTGHDASGRTLDFLAQEMLREINTIGAKCGDLDIARSGVIIKTELERIREQIQNVE
ncbi:YicC/YloC family endoribonuclease [Kiritimatiella glycovorans]|uniref:YicC family protein n=1 Tax=Kiritimatiella glycovorans TaxID=1307763 RepID=A0A0G3EH71_9BACT|nr:YicC/YloC family endoribonuclease [Kiritimatiella glycovorans]AKJ63489.1 hypothetical protein L21SP4_00205 [Kiritimatiella glycovorans]